MIMNKQDIRQEWITAPKCYPALLNLVYVEIKKRLH